MKIAQEKIYFLRDHVILFFCILTENLGLDFFSTFFYGKLQVMSYRTPKDEKIYVTTIREKYNDNISL